MPGKWLSEDDFLFKVSQQCKQAEEEDIVEGGGGGGGVEEMKWLLQR